MKHTPEPWNLHRCYDGHVSTVHDHESHDGIGFDFASLSIAKGECLIGEINYQSISKGFPKVENVDEMRANAERIIACVNACASIVNPAAIQGAVKALRFYIEAYPHDAPHDCFATGPKTGDAIQDLVVCPGCQAKRLAEEALAALEVEG